MGRKTLGIPFDPQGRCRICLELDDPALIALSEIQHSFGRLAFAPSISQILRAALIAFRKGGDYCTAVDLPFVRQPRRSAERQDQLSLHKEDQP